MAKVTKWNPTPDGAEWRFVKIGVLASKVDSRFCHPECPFFLHSRLDHARAQCRLNELRGGEPEDIIGPESLTKDEVVWGENDPFLRTGCCQGMDEENLASPASKWKIPTLRCVHGTGEEMVFGVEGVSDRAALDLVMGYAQTRASQSGKEPVLRVFDHEFQTSWSLMFTLDDPGYGGPDFSKGYTYCKGIRIIRTAKSTFEHLEGVPDVNELILFDEPVDGYSKYGDWADKEGIPVTSIGRRRHGAELYHEATDPAVNEAAAKKRSES